MSKKSYSSLEYVAQRVQHSLQNLLKQKFGGEMRVKHSYNPEKNLSNLSYAPLEMQVNIDFSMNGKERIHMKQEVSLGDEESHSERILNIVRSKKGRISDQYAMGLASELFDLVKKFYNEIKQ